MNSEFSVSVKHGSTKITGSSAERFAGIGVDNLIRIEGSNDLYTIINKEREFVIKDFTAPDGKTLVIKSVSENNLQRNDSIMITYKEYELLGVFDIIEAGNNYEVGDDLVIDGGISNIDMSSGETMPTILTVTELNPFLGVLKLSVKTAGSYISPPPETCKLISSKNGLGAIVSVKYRPKENRTVADRTIVGINRTATEIYLYLDYSLPLHVTEGKLSVEKYSLIINSPFNGPTATNASYQVYRDFTPHMQIPLMLRGSLSPESVFNKAMRIIDDRFNQLESKINKP